MDLKNHYEAESQLENETTFMSLLSKHSDSIQPALIIPLLWPEFVEVDGLVFLKDNVTSEDNVELDRIHQASIKPEGISEQMHRSFNTIEIPEMVYDISNSEPLESEVELLVAVMQEMWGVKLSAEYKDRRHHVVVSTLEDFTDAVAIGFYEAKC